ncbi:MAG: YibE/F family protein, partial [Synergistaceae bacterium]|nr:YibE/F family protein [Synergistaceae bacterium]
MKMKTFIMKIIIALIFAGAFYYAADYFAVRNWNNNESLIVRVIEAGPEQIIPPENEQEESYEMLERKTVIQVLSGNNKDEVLSVNTVRLSGTGIEIIPGRRYLLVWDMFSDGRVQYSIADAFRVPSLAGIIMGICALFIALTGRRGFFALFGLGASITVLVFTMIPLISQGWQPVPLALASVLIISTVTILCVVPYARYRLVALLGSLGGALCGFASGALMVYVWQLIGLSGEGAALLASTLPG